MNRRLAYALTWAALAAITFVLVLRQGPDSLYVAVFAWTGGWLSATLTARPVA